MIISERTDALYMCLTFEMLQLMTSLTYTNTSYDHSDDDVDNMKHIADVHIIIPNL